MADLSSRDHGERLFTEFISHYRLFKSSVFIGKHGHMPNSGDATSSVFSGLGASLNGWRSLEHMGISSLSSQGSQMVMEESRLCLKPQKSWVAEGQRFTLSRHEWSCDMFPPASLKHIDEVIRVKCLK